MDWYGAPESMWDWCETCHKVVEITDIHEEGTITGPNTESVFVVYDYSCGHEYADFKSNRNFP